MATPSTPSSPGSSGVLNAPTAPPAVRRPGQPPLPNGQGGYGGHGGQGRQNRSNPGGGPGPSGLSGLRGLHGLNGPGDPDPSVPPPPEPHRARRGFGLIGPRRDRHVLPSDRSSALSLPVGDDGVVIGVDTLNQPAVLGLFRPAQFDVVLVGGMWTAQILALRAVATGARVAIETGRGQAWQPMAQAAGGGMQCVTVHAVGQVAPQGPSVSSPVLVVRDCGARPPRGRLAAGPWQSVLTLLPYLGPTARRLLGNAGLVGVQRVSPQEAEVVGQVMGLAPEDVAALSTLGDNVTLWCTRRHRALVMTQPTDAETGLLGSPRRVD